MLRKPLPFFFFSPDPPPTDRPTDPTTASYAAWGGLRWAGARATSDAPLKVMPLGVLEEKKFSGSKKVEKDANKWRD